MIAYPEYATLIRRHSNVARVREHGAVQENGRSYPLFRIDLEGNPDKLLVITTGFHGEEPAGPLTMASFLPDIVDYARSKDVSLCIFPCINPSGFEAGTRYNASGEKPNNDFLRYEVKPGEWKGELDDGEEFLRYELFDGGPKETRAVREELKGVPRPVGALDIHQDRYLEGAWTYAYVFGDRARFRPLMKQAAEHAQVAANQSVDGPRHTDADGLVEFHDGSVTDYYERLGVPHTATLETTTHAPLGACHQVNLIWIRGFIDLVAKHG